MAKIDKKWSKRYQRDMWGFDCTVKGKRIRDYTFKRQSDAELALNTLLGRVKLEDYGIAPKAAKTRITMKQLIEERIRRQAVRQDSDLYYSRKSSERVLNEFLKLLPKGMRVEDFTAQQFALYRDKRIQEVSPQTTWREINDIQACLNAAAEYFPALEDWRPPKRPKLKVPTGERTAIITPEQGIAMVNDLRRPKEPEEQSRQYKSRLDMADLFQFGLQSLARKGALRKAKWSDINWHWKTLTLKDKNNKRAPVNLPESLVEMLKDRRWKQEPPSDYIFPSDLNPKRPISRVNLEAIKKSAERLGIPWGYDTEDGIVFHTTRHSGVTLMIENDVDVKTIQEQSRHSTGTMVMRYMHSSPKKRREAAAILEAFNPKNDDGILSGAGGDEGISGVGGESAKRRKA